MNSLWSRIRGKSPEPDKASERWRSTLQAASRVPFYARWKRELSRAQQASTIETRSEALLRLPEIELDYFFRHFRQFREKDDAAAKSRGARWLWPTESRVAIVAPWFHAGGSVKLLLKPDIEELHKHAPDVVAAPVDILETFAAVGEWPQDTPLFALVALAGIGTPLLTEPMRLRLWRSLGVPVYVQLRGFQGELLARECEAHNGLHFDPADVLIERRPSGELLISSLDNQRHPVLRLASRLEASFDSRVCGCGLATPRLVNLQPAKGRGAHYADPTPPSLSALAAAVGDAQGVPANTLAQR